MIRIHWSTWCAAVGASYSLGVLNERWWPGDRLVPATHGEAALWLLVVALLALPFGLGWTRSDETPRSENQPPRRDR